MSDRCRHRRFWGICGGSLLWCYECGAIRMMHRVEGTNGAIPVSVWQAPTGKDSTNPWEEFSVRSDRWCKRYGS